MRESVRAHRPQPEPENRFVSQAVEAAVRIGMLFLLVAWCFEIVRPFIVVVAWAIIIATATHPAYSRLETAFAGRRTLAAVVFTLLMLVVLIVPMVMLSGKLVDTAHVTAEQLSTGSLSIPPPPDGVAEWPLVGRPLYRLWSMASHNLGSALEQIGPQLKSVGGWLLSAAAGVGVGLVQFLIAIIIAGVLLARADSSSRTAHAIAVRLAGNHGDAFADLAQATVRSVARGIIGVALVQTLVASIGFLAVGLPAAGVLSLLCLMLAVVQIGMLPILLPAAIYVFSTHDPLTASLFAAWCVFTAVIDNVLKPILLGRGVKVPMMVIFVGAIGGFIASGIIGLFVGAVVLALSYTLTVAWLGIAAAPDVAAAATNPPAPPSPASFDRP